MNEWMNERRSAHLRMTMESRGIYGVTFFGEKPFGEKLPPLLLLLLFETKKTVGTFFLQNASQPSLCPTSPSLILQNKSHIVKCQTHAKTHCQTRTRTRRRPRDFAFA